MYTVQCTVYTSVGCTENAPCTAICSCILHSSTTCLYDLYVTFEHKRGSVLRWMDVLGNKFTWKTHCVSLSPVWLHGCGLPGTVRPIWQASDYPVTALQGWNMFLISVKLPAANSIMCDSSPAVFFLILCVSEEHSTDSSFLPVLTSFFSKFFFKFFVFPLSQLKQIFLDIARSHCIQAKVISVWSTVHQVHSTAFKLHT